MMSRQLVRSKGKNWLLTWPQCNEGPDKIISELQDKFTENVQYICVSAEVHVDGSPHRHGFVALKEAIKFTPVLFDIHNSIEGASDYHGNYQVAKAPKDALRYVQKDGVFREIGTCPFKSLMTTAEKNEMYLTKCLEDLVDSGDVSLFKYAQLMKARNAYMMSRAANQKRQKPTVYWLYGPTGSGKTRYAVEKGGESYWISNDCKWFDGYSGQTTAILDDIRAGSYTFEFLLRLLDRYPVLVQVKGGFAVWNPLVIYITAPARPEQVFINHETGETWDRIDQLLRRIDEILEFPREATQPTQEWQEIPEGDDGMGEYYTMKTNWISQ